MIVMHENASIQELSFGEIDEISGGFLPVVIPLGAVVKAAATSTTAKVVYLAAAGAVATAVGYENNRVETDD